MSVPLSISITSPRQGNHISNAGIGINFLYLWLLMQWTKIFAQSKTRLKKNTFGAQTGACRNKEIQKEEKSKMNSLTVKQRFGLDVALFWRNWKHHNKGKKIVALKIKNNLFVFLKYAKDSWDFCQIIQFSCKFQKQLLDFLRFFDWL